MNNIFIFAYAFVEAYFFIPGGNGITRFPDAYDIQLSNSQYYVSSRSEARSVHVHILVKCHADRMSK